MKHLNAGVVPITTVTLKQINKLFKGRRLGTTSLWTRYFAAFKDAFNITASSGYEFANYITTDGVSANVLFVKQVKRQAKEDFDEAQKTRREALLQATINYPCNTVSVDLGINPMLTGTVNGRNTLLWNLPPEEKVPNLYQHIIKGDGPDPPPRILHDVIMWTNGKWYHESGVHRNTTMRKDREYSAVKFRERNSTDQPVLLPRYYFEAGRRLRTSKTADPTKFLEHAELVTKHVNAVFDFNSARYFRRMRFEKFKSRERAYDAISRQLKGYQRGRPRIVIRAPALHPR